MGAVGKESDISDSTYFGHEFDGTVGSQVAANCLRMGVIGYFRDLWAVGEGVPGRGMP